MQTLFLTYRDGGDGVFSVPDDFGDEHLHFLLDDHAYVQTFYADDNIQVTVAIRGADVRTAVLTSGGQVHGPEQPTATGEATVTLDDSEIAKHRPSADYGAALAKIGDAYANIEAETQTGPPPDPPKRAEPTLS